LFAGQLVFVGEEERISGRGGVENPPESFVVASKGVIGGAVRGR
jgi:hypothetical protein